jgi:hypothetical protein
MDIGLLWSAMEAPVYLLCTHQEAPIGHQLSGVKLPELSQNPWPLTLHAGRSSICWSRTRYASRKSLGTSHLFQPSADLCQLLLPSRVGFRHLVRLSSSVKTDTRFWPMTLSMNSNRNEAPVGVWINAETSGPIR